jgi:hypothetical protein
MESRAGEPAGRGRRQTGGRETGVRLKSKGRLRLRLRVEAGTAVLERLGAELRRNPA